MAANAGQVVRAILSKLIVSDPEASVEPADTQDTIFAMNNYMTALDADGISLGYTEVVSIDQVLTVAPGAIQGIIFNVAIVMAPDFGAIVDAATIEGAKFGLSAMRKLARNIQPVIFPSTMPRGSGNEDYWNSDRHFFPGPDEAIVTETDRFIQIEDNTDVS